MNHKPATQKSPTQMVKGKAQSAPKFKKSASKQPTNEQGKAMSVPLSRQLQATAAVVQAVLAGRSLTAELTSVSPDLRPGVQALTFQVMRQLGRAMALRERLATKAPPPAADALLCTALALSWQGEGAPYPVHTLVNQAVEAARQQRQTQAQSGFINACLRRFLREREVLVADTDSDPQARWNHPRWWVTRVKDEYPEDWEKLLDMAQEPAPMSLRVDTRHQSVADYQAQLLAMGLVAKPVGATGLQCGDVFFLHRTVARQHELYLFGGDRFGSTLIQGLQHLHGTGGFGLVAIHFELLMAVGDFHVQGQFDGAQMFVGGAA
jgi:16S rRNA (cytosine967-C5)-methyltransferase